MPKNLLPLSSAFTLALLAFAACTIGDPDDPSSGDGDDMGGEGDGDGMGGAGDGDGDGSTGGVGGQLPVFASCADENGGCDEVCDDSGDEVTCSCLQGAKLGADARSCVPLTVLYLGNDGLNNDIIYDRLIIEGFNVIDATPFPDWDGEMPSLDEVDAVVFLQGWNYDLALTSAADQALTDWMLEGGTVIRSEWIAYQIAKAGSESEFDQYLPVDSLDGEAAYDAEWTVTAPAHPLSAGLDSSWMNADGGCSVIDVAPTATVVAETDLCGPSLTYDTYGDEGGKVIHINDDFGEDQFAEPDPATLNILVNAINFSL